MFATSEIMNSPAQQKSTYPSVGSVYQHTRDMSDASSAEANSTTDSSSAFTRPSAQPAPSQIKTFHPSLSSSRSRHTNLDMTVYYHYDQHGNVQATSTDDPLAQDGVENLDLRPFEQKGDVVGAYLAQRDKQFRIYPSTWPPSHNNSTGHASWQHPSAAYPGSHQVDPRHPNIYQGNSYSGMVSQPLQYSHYPDADNIRHLHTLRSLLNHIPIEHRKYCLNNHVVNIVEADTGIVFANNVSMHMLNLFLGYRSVNKLIRIRPDSEHPVLLIPRNTGSRVAFRILISWVIQACRSNNLGSFEQFRVPRNTYAACSLAQILAFFELHKDALRVDHTIEKEHLRRPIFADELETIWNCLGENSRYTYAVIKGFGKQLQEHEKRDPSPASLKWQKALEVLEKYPRLKARVRDLELNESYQPNFTGEPSRISAAKNKVPAPQIENQQNAPNEV